MNPHERPKLRSPAPHQAARRASEQGSAKERADTVSQEGEQTVPLPWPHRGQAHLRPFSSGLCHPTCFRRQHVTEMTAGSGHETAHLLPQPSCPSAITERKAHNGLGRSCPISSQTSREKKLPSRALWGSQAQLTHNL